MASGPVVSCLLLALLGALSLGSHAISNQGDALRKLMEAKLGGKYKYSQSVMDSRQILSPEWLLVPQNGGSKARDKIVKLPGQPKNVDFNQYSGYVNVNAEAGRALFYYFAEAQGFQQDSKPLLLWLNGGPGCSSLGFGAMMEIGPFRVKSDGMMLFRNPLAWNRVANVLFLESPIGTGFSYSNRTSDYKTTGDNATARDAYVFLLNWMERFPEYKNRDFYISGESYAGHYVPQLAQTILQYNRRANKTLFNLKGIIAGNPLIHDDTDQKGRTDFLWTHSLISDEVFQTITKYCNQSSYNFNDTEVCEKAQIEKNDLIVPVDSANIYGPSECRSAATGEPSVFINDPCSKIYVDYYLNLPQVQQALHANLNNQTVAWQHCSGKLQYDWIHSPPTVLPVLRALMASGLRVWIFSGDVDATVPTISTRYSINTMKLPVKTRWAPWYVDGEVGGYSVTYEGDLTLATVRGGGHMVPIDRPSAAYVIIRDFIKGTPLPSQNRQSAVILE